VRVYAHRGASAYRPENTLAAFELARRLGADGVELDVRRCASGEAVVVHDADLKRVAGVDVRVADTRLSDLSRFDVGEGEGIPSLEAVFEATGPSMRVNVELKAESARPTGLEAAVARAVRRSGAGHRTLFSCFHPVPLLRLWRLLPRVPRALLFGSEQPIHLRRGWHRLGLPLSAVHPEHVLLDAAAVGRWHRRGLAVNAWTVNDPVRVRALSLMGIDGVITDRPDLARDALMGIA
jgi:glycerophosphoryl diester phosphodiesterase